jgi:oxidase EvaA
MIETEKIQHGKIIAEMIQCDEGGRFYQNDSQYQLILVKEGENPKPNQIWMRLTDLQSFLQGSNRAAFQLRCISSMILDLISPATFG